MKMIDSTDKRESTFQINYHDNIFFEYWGSKWLGILKVKQRVDIVVNHLELIDASLHLMPKTLSATLKYLEKFIQLKKFKFFFIA